MSRNVDLERACLDFQKARASGDRYRAWIAWYGYRALRESWDDQPDGPDYIGAYEILGQAEAWRRGFRPPTTFHEANGRIRRRIRQGKLRGPGTGI